MEPVIRTPKPPTFTDKVRHLAQNFLKFCQKLLHLLAKSLRRFALFLKRSWKKFLRRFTKWLDPKLEPYRAHPRNPSAPSTNNSSADINPDKTGTHSPIANPDDLKAPSFQPPKIKIDRPAEIETATSLNQPIAPSANILDDTPQTRAEIFEILAQAPHGVFSQRERNMITNLLALPDTRVSDLMLPATKIVYVEADEVLGPLTLDRLYRSGLSHFPVKDAKGELIGCVHTTHFNNLDIRQSSRASEILDPGLYYIRDDYSLEQALNTFLRTSAFFLLVTDRYGKIAGLLTFDTFMHHLFGTNPKDTFDRDNDRLAVANRRKS